MKKTLNIVKKYWDLGAIAVGLVLCIGCGGSSSSDSSSSSSLPEIGNLPAQTSAPQVHFINQVGPEVQSIFSREVAYTDQQFSQNVNPVWGISAHAMESVGAPDPTQLTVILQAGPPLVNANGSLANTLIEGNWAYVQYNNATISDGGWPSRMNHGALDLAKFPIGQTFEGTDYNPTDFSQTQMDGYWWLCDWATPSGADFLSTLAK